MRLRVSIKLAAAVMLLVLTIGGAIALALNALSVERSRLEYLLGRPVQQAETAAQALLALKDLSLAVQTMIVAPTDAGKQAAIAAMGTHEAALRARLATLRRLIAPGTAPGSMPGNMGDLDRFASALQAYFDLADHMAGLARLNSRNHAHVLSNGASATAFSQLEQQIQAMLKDAKARAKEHDPLAPQIAMGSQALLAGLNRFYRIEKEIVAESEPERLDALGKSADQAADSVAATVDDLSSYAFSRLAPAGMTELMSTVSDEFDRWVDADREIRRLAHENGDGQAALLAATTGRTLLEAAAKAGDALVAGSAASMRTELERARTGYLASRNALLAIAIGGSLLSLAVVLAIVQGQVARPLRRLGRAMAAIAAREDVAIPGLARGDEIGDMARALQVFRQEMNEAEALRDRQESAKEAAEAERRHTLRSLAAQFEFGRRRGRRFGRGGGRAHGRRGRRRDRGGRDRGTPGRHGARRRGAGLRQRAARRRRGGAARRLHRRDRRPHPRHRARHRDGGRGGAAERGGDARAARRGAGDRPGGRARARDRGAHQPARAERDHRGRACGRGRPRLRRGRRRGEDAGRPDRARHRADRQAGGDDPAADRPGRVRNPRHRQPHRRHGRSSPRRSPRRSSSNPPPRARSPATWSRRRVAPHRCRMRWGRSMPPPPGPARRLAP